MTPIQQFIYTRTYSRWLQDQQRRETYPETINRYLQFMRSTIGGDVVTTAAMDNARASMVRMEALPSMRALWAAGDVAKDNHITLYNCAYLTISDIQAFSETLFILMCGTGVGFSVERRFVDHLPALAATPTGNTFSWAVEDSRMGWAVALDMALRALWRGDDVTVDYSAIRPRGARLKTMGGRASGPEPLRSLIDFAINLFRQKRARRHYRLSTIDCLDLQNKTAEAVVMGGVRRSSEISLSDLDDRSIADAKSGDFWTVYPHRSMSNNSAVYYGRPDIVTFLEETTAMIKARSGERGIFNREAAWRQMTASGRRQVSETVGCNPCAEILLRDCQFCNLSEVVVRSDDTLASLRKKVRMAVMFGVWQASMTTFPYLRSQWAANCQEERLLGVSMTGIMDNPVLNNINDTMKQWLGDLKGVAISECEKWCNKLGINMSAAITCVKPSGTVSQLVDSASGIHPRYSDHYIRRYRISATDPLFKMMADQGVPYFPEAGQDPAAASTYVLEFPVEAPVSSVTRHHLTALQQLEHWRVVKEFWCEHNPSCTVYVGDEEWPSVLGWTYDHFDTVCGLSFLPKSNHVYQLAPYQDCTKQEYQQRLSAFPVIDYSQLSKYEMDDTTDGAQSYACVGGSCDI